MGVVNVSLDGFLMETPLSLTGVAELLRDRGFSLMGVAEFLRDNVVSLTGVAELLREVGLSLTGVVGMFSAFSLNDIVSVCLGGENMTIVSFPRVVSCVLLFFAQHMR